MDREFVYFPVHDIIKLELTRDRLRSFVRFRSFDFVRSISFFRFRSFDFVRSISFVRFRSFDFVRSISFVRFRSFDFVRSISFVRFRSFDFVRSISFVRFHSFDFVRSISFVRLLVCSFVRFCSLRRHVKRLCGRKTTLEMYHTLSLPATIYLSLKTTQHKLKNIRLLQNRNVTIGLPALYSQY